MYNPKVYKSGYIHTGKIDRDNGNRARKNASARRTMRTMKKRFNRELDRMIQE
jgi:hypothetical protein